MSQSSVIRIGSRGSKLALWQANYVQRELEKLGHKVSLTIIKTQGDQIQHLSFDKMEGKGFFTKEIESALLRNEIDLAVHSHKDLETTNPEGLSIGAVSSRAALHDLLVINKKAFQAEEILTLKQNAIVGTSSARRKTQLKHFRQDVTIKDLRGNVPTRLDKLRNGDYDAIILAAAGVERLEIDMYDFEVFHFDPKSFVPAPAQGVLGYQIRKEDIKLKEIIQPLHDSEVSTCIEAERYVMRNMDGGCQMPLGVYCYQENNLYKMHAAHAQDSNSLPEYFVLENDCPTTLAQNMLKAIQKLS